MARNGLSYRQITHNLHVSMGRVQDGVRRHREAEPALNAEVCRTDLYHALDSAVRRLTRIMEDDTASRGEVTRAAVALVQVIKERADLAGAHAPPMREVLVHTVTPEALQAEQERLRAELLAAGVPPAALPTPDDYVEWIEARVIEATKQKPEAIIVAWP